MRMHPLLMGGSSGLPRSGLVGLWDPYRDVYGRNVLPTNIDTLTGWQANRVTLAASSFTDTTDTGTHGIYRTTGIANGQGRVFGYSVKVKATNGMVALRLGQNNTEHVVIVNLTTGAIVLAKGCSATVGNVDGDGYRRVTMTVTSYNDAIQTDVLLFVYAAPTNATSYAALSYTGSAETPITVYAKEFKLDLGYPTPYSAPVGAPVTLQTATDYSGRGNHLTLGATTGVSTDDPAYTGTAWSFDGGDFLTAGRPAQLEVAQPFCGYIVVKVGADGTVMAFIGKHNAMSSGSGNKGFCVLVNSSNKGCMYVFQADGTYKIITLSSVALTTASGYHGIFFGWDGAYANFAVDNIQATPVAAPTYNPATTKDLTLGKYSYTTNGFLTGEIAYASMWAGVCWPTAVSTRIHNYVKSLMAGRGVTVA